jgi:acetyl-CoA decarbonylase/synthase complex subunit beta
VSKKLKSSGGFENMQLKLKPKAAAAAPAAAPAAGASAAAAPMMAAGGAGGIKLVLKDAKISIDKVVLAK